MYAISNDFSKHSFLAVIGNSLQRINFYSKTIETLATGIEGEVRNIDIDTSLNIIFISTKNEGCYYYYNKVLRKLPLYYNYLALNCHYILQDKDKDYWLPTNFGLYFLEHNNLKAFLKNNKLPLVFRKFGTEDGILNEEFNGGFQNAGLIYKDTIYLANMDGTVSFNYNIKKIKNNSPSNLILDYLQVDSQAVYKISEKFNVAPNFNFIKIKLALSFANNENRIEYRLIGRRDSSWHLTNTDGIAIINNLSHGIYTFETRSTINPEKKISFKFEILPYWYNTLLAKFLFIALVVVSIYIVYAWRWQNTYNKYLKKQEAQRKKMMSIIAHDLNSPISNFAELSSNVQYLLENNDFETIKALEQEMGEKSKNLQLLLNNILLWSMTTDKILKIKLEPIDINEVFNEILPIYKDIANYRSINIETKIDYFKIPLESDKTLISIILRNLIDNAIKNCNNNSTIKIIYTSIPHQKICIRNTVVHQNGNEVVAFLNKIFKQKNKPNPYEEGIGFGICILFEALSLLKANIKYTFKDGLIYTEINL